ncbi:MAG: LuxR C-terminal-related transcriptional regulator [Cyanobacteria bacterium J06600_6]
MEAERISHEVLLSTRELEIVELVVTGLSNHKIAQQLEISKRTVDNHISNILKKTGVSNRVELVRWSLQWGKVCLDKINCCSIAGLTPNFAQDEAVS